uniref:Kell metallo-endopeptidase (Kell blood group) n=1 Tax=Strigops habroptila TaxID=2489341 RepID=A0A672UJ12_STRHB
MQSSCEVKDRTHFVPQSAKTYKEFDTLHAKAFLPNRNLWGEISLLFTSCPGSCDVELGLTLLARLLDSRNDTVDPCEDFYKYACGSWEGKHSSRATEESLNVFDVLMEENQLILKRLLEEPQFGIRGSAKEKAIQFYHSCMDTQKIESQGTQPLKDLLNQIGGWNITGVGKAKDFNETLQTLMGRYSTFPFFRVLVGPSPFDLKTNIIQVIKFLPLVICSVLQVLRVYLTYLKKLGGLLGGPQDGPPDSFSLTLSFISNLQRVVTPLQERQQRGMLFFHTTIRELQEKAPAIDWLSCLQAVFHPMQMNLSQPIAVHDMDYIRGMSQLIEQWHKERNINHKLKRSALESAEQFSGHAFFSSWQAEQMFSEIQDALYDQLDQLKWMDEQTRQKAKVLVRAEGKRVNTFYFSFSASSWHVSPWTVRSYYSIRHHMVVFPAGMFRSPFFHTKFPSAVNFGAIGVFMAHELLHTFYGYVLPGGCPTCDRGVLQKSIDCLVEQYESYGSKVNGTFTLLENTADTGGLAIAYQTDSLSWFASFQAMCGNQDPEKLQSSLNTDSHSPLPLRVCGPVSNSQDFAKHFHCSSGSPMNPDKKCHIW